MRKRWARRAFLEGFSSPYSEVYLSYGMKREARFKAGKDAPKELLDLADQFFDRDGALREDPDCKVFLPTAGGGGQNAKVRGCARPSSRGPA